MAATFTAGADRTTGDVITAANWNAYLGADGSIDYLNELNAMATKSADETVNNSNTLQDDDHLSFSVEANSVYLVELFFRIQSTSATPDFKFAFTLPSGASGQGTYQSSNTAWSRDDDITVASAILNVGLAGIGTHEIFTGTYFINTAGTAGTAQLQWAQNTATAEDMKLLKGSSIRYRKIA